MKQAFCLKVIALCAAVFALFASCSANKAGAVSYEFTGIRRGNLERTVSSSGTINPVATVRVLPRMSGKVEEVHFDYNDTVKRGDVLARLNTDMLRLQRDQLNSSVQKARANYELQLINFRSQEALAERGLISEFELRSARTNLNNQRADLAVAESNLRVKETEINQYAFITSPIDGIVLDRNINVGDTVVDSASNNSSSIFTIAENLREMQIEAMVGELDVTSISKEQQVRFTLESLPGRRFRGVVENIRMIPVVSSGVVSYTVIINVDNRDGSLMPGMTCAVDFIVESAEDILMVPNAALRYLPTSLSADQVSEMQFNASLANMNEEQKEAAIKARAEQAAAQRQTQNSNQGLSQIMMGNQTNANRMAGGSGTRRQAGGSGEARRARPTVVYRNLWFVSGDGKLEVMQVRTGISDGVNTEIITDEDLEGRQVILRERI
ncbi:MAG: efflux RND transporter periplasmic adaptor subunit [Treponema sp.]|nr:efflux RND transporter periplasmic adaptor subunit [Treponema sp.]MCL2237243.1 efflux RND transporter periplasmic adaptor subunit [Treponema sp.]